MIFSEPEYVEMTPELKKKLDDFRDAHEGAPLGPIAHQILFEDDRVRIWQMELAPGEASALHHHENAYSLCVFSGDEVAGVVPKDSPLESYVAKVPKEGNTVPVPKGVTEWAWNIGNVPYSEILIELKNS